MQQTERWKTRLSRQQLHKTRHSEMEQENKVICGFKLVIYDKHLPNSIFKNVDTEHSQNLKRWIMFVPGDTMHGSKIKEDNKDSNVFQVF